MTRAERDRRIVAAAERGVSYRVLASRYGISVERVRQIVVQHTSNTHKENNNGLVTAHQAHTVDLVTAHLIGAVTAIIDDHARRAGVPAKLLAQRLAESISGGQGR